GVKGLVYSVEAAVTCCGSAAETSAGHNFYARTHGELQYGAPLHVSPDISCEITPATELTE
ncbi:hypothetical protein BaRGS_00037236, partial [Batillaria attramentaria]